MFKYLSLLLIVSSYGFAQDFSCFHFAHMNHDTGEKKKYSKTESNNMPPFNFTLTSNKIYVDLPTGNKELFMYKDTKGGTTNYFSTNNYYLRQNLKNPEVWYFDMRLQGQLQTALLICR